MLIWMYVIPEKPLIWATGMHGLFVTILVTTLVVNPPCGPFSLLIATEDNYVILNPMQYWYIVHGLFVTIMVTTKRPHICMLTDD